MLINKPCCDFKMCRNHFDGNCMNTTEYERCSYNRQKAEIERLNTMHSEMCIGMKVLKKTAIKEYIETQKEKAAVMYDILIRFSNGSELMVSNVIDDVIETKNKTLKIITEDNYITYFNFESIIYYGRKKTIENKVTYNWE